MMRTTGAVGTLVRAIGYIRVSTEEQASGGGSLATQESKLRAYAALYGIELIDVIVDAGVSAKSLDRPGIREALARLDRGEADGILISKLDRLSRSVGDWDHLIKHYFGERAGFQLWSVADAIDTRTAAGRMVLNILMSVAQWERETIGERTHDVLQNKQIRGEKTGGSIPYGQMLGESREVLVKGEVKQIKTLVPNPIEQAVIEEIRRLKAAGETLRRIATELNARGIQRRGGKWDHTVVSRLLKAAA